MRIITPDILDADRLFEIEFENYGSEESTDKDTFKEIIEFPEDFKGYSLKALMCDSVCGFYCTVEEEEEEKVELVDIAVLKSEQGKGLGSILLAHCLSENQGKTVSLTVREDNISAIKLYEKFGFQKLKVVEDYYDDCSGVKYTKKVSDQIKSYHEITKDASASQFLLKTLDLSELLIGNALELGCGAGNDSLELLKRGWEVTAIDRSYEGIQFLTDKSKGIGNIDIRNTSFELMELKPDYYNLVYSRYSLSFCQSPEWPKVWTNILSSLKSGGVISMHLFGENDGFKDSRRHGQMTFFNSTKIDEMMDSFEVIMKHEKEEDAKSAVGEMKHWHVFTVVGRKI